MVALNNEDRAYIKEAATNIAANVSKEIIENIMKWHIQSCPHGKAILAAKWAVIGACFVSAAGGGTIGAILMRLIK